MKKTLKRTPNVMFVFVFIFIILSVIPYTSKAQTENKEIEVELKKVELINSDFIPSEQLIARTKKYHGDIKCMNCLNESNIGCSIEYADDNRFCMEFINIDDAMWDLLLDENKSSKYRMCKTYIEFIDGSKFYSDKPMILEDKGSILRLHFFGEEDLLKSKLLKTDIKLLKTFTNKVEDINYSFSNFPSTKIFKTLRSLLSKEKPIYPSSSEPKEVVKIIDFIKRPFKALDLNEKTTKVRVNVMLIYIAGLKSKMAEDDGKIYIIKEEGNSYGLPYTHISGILDFDENEYLCNSRYFLYFDDSKYSLQDLDNIASGIAKSLKLSIEKNFYIGKYKSKIIIILTEAEENLMVIEIY